MITNKDNSTKQWKEGSSNKNIAIFCITDNDVNLPYSNALIATVLIQPL